MRRTKLVCDTLLFAAVALILCAALAVPASGADITVGAEGQYKTIQQAVDAAKPGDTVSVAPGTYTENVVVNKPLTITAASARPTVQAADPSKDVFMLSSPGVRIDGLTITGGASGVQIQSTSKCVVTNIVARDNVRAVYLSHSTDNEISNSNLTGNGYGVYGDSSSRNTISSNVATGEKGNGIALGDGIFLNYGDSNTITRNDLSANYVFGISLYNSVRNIISNNTMSDNDRIGVRFGPGSNDNTLTFNTIARNSLIPQPVAETFPACGVLIVSSTGNQIYLNSFISQPNAIVGASTAILNSREQLVYTYNGVERTGYMSNYYSDYTGTDANGTGIGSPPSAYGDKYPLLQSVASYGNIIPASAVTPTPSSGQPSGQNESVTTSSGNQSNTGTLLPGFEASYAVAGFAIAALVLLGKRYRAK
jgi:parallel beta-helix repeat protein